MNCARNYENMLNFVKVVLKILLVPFFRTRCIFKTIHRARVYNMHWQTIPHVNYPLREKVLTYIVPGEVLD